MDRGMCGEGEGGGGGGGMGLTGSKECKIKLQRRVIPHSTIMLLVCVGGGWPVRKRQVCRVAMKYMAKFCKQFLQYYYFHREVPAAHFGARKKFISTVSCILDEELQFTRIIKINLIIKISHSRNCQIIN